MNLEPVAVAAIFVAALGFGAYLLRERWRFRDAADARAASVVKSKADALTDLDKRVAELEEWRKNTQVQRLSRPGAMPFGG